MRKCISRIVIITIVTTLMFGVAQATAWRVTWSGTAAWPIPAAAPAAQAKGTATTSCVLPVRQF